MLHTAITLITTNSAAYGTLQGAMVVSLERVAIGFALGGAAGLILAVIAGLGWVRTRWTHCCRCSAHCRCSG